MLALSDPISATGEPPDSTVSVVLLPPPQSMKPVPSTKTSRERLAVSPLSVKAAPETCASAGSGS